VALDPYRRKTRSSRLALGGPAKRSRVPLVMGVLGLLAMVALVFQLGTLGFRSKTTQMFAWHIQSPP